MQKLIALFPISENSVEEQIKADYELAEKLQGDDICHTSDEAEELEKNPFFIGVESDVHSHQTLEEGLKIVREENNSSELKFYVQRSRVLKNVLEELKECTLSTTKIRVEFIGEPAVDTGGPTRELFSLAFKQAVDAKITRGASPNITFMHDQSALREGDYKKFGQLVALSLLNGASGPHFFCPVLVHYVLSVEVKPDPLSLISQLPDENHELRDKLKVLVECKDQAAWNDAILNFDERFDMGINKANIPIQEKGEVIKAVVKHVLVSSVAEEIFSFQEGLSVFGVMDLLKQYPESCIKEMTYAQVTVEEIRQSFVPSFSVPGSAKREQEEMVMFNFNQFLKQCHKGTIVRTVVDLEVLESQGIVTEVSQSLHLNDVLQFLSGSRYHPVGGMEGVVEFSHDAEPGARVKSNTCALMLTIPVNPRYATEDHKVFSSNFADDIFDGPGYGTI